MAEIAIVVTDEQRPDHRAQDGDVLFAVNDRRIRHVHAWRICDPRAAGFNQHGLRIKGGLGQFILDTTMQFRFERVAPNQSLRTTLATGEIEAINHARLPLWLARRTANPRHLIFGTPGAEMWYGGRADNSAAKAALLWDRIEADTPHRAAANTRWPFTESELRDYLVLPVVDMRDEIVNRAMSTEIDFDVEQPEYNPDAGAGDQIVRKRRANLAWRDLGLNIADVLDPSKRIDLRDALDPQGTQHLRVKRRINAWTARSHLRPTSDREFFV